MKFMRKNYSLHVYGRIKKPISCCNIIYNIVVAVQSDRINLMFSIICYSFVSENQFDTLSIYDVKRIDIEMLLYYNVVQRALSNEMF